MPADQAIRPSGEKLAHDTAPDLWGRSDAVFNEARTHRYLLTRRWAQGGLTATFLMLNPSTATALDDVNTIRRCIGFARREGCNALTVVNLFALRATNPTELYDHPDPVGPRNDEFLAEHCLPGRLVVAAWGAHGTFRDRSDRRRRNGPGRGARVAKRLTVAGVDLLCLGTTTSGQPRHPLYRRGDEPLIPYVP